MGEKEKGLMLLNLGLMKIRLDSASKKSKGYETLK